MFWVILLLQLQLISTSAFTSCEFKQFGYSAMFLVNACRQAGIMDYGLEYDVHAMDVFIRGLVSEHPAVSLKKSLEVVEREYLKYLQRLRATELGRRNVGDLVKRLTKFNTTDYNLRTTQVVAPHFSWNTGCQQSSSQVRDQRFGGDLILQEYFKGSLAALEAYSTTLNDYQKCTRFPPIRRRRGLLHQIGTFIATQFRTYDYAATFPDAVMCFSALQYIKYTALIDSNLTLVDGAIQECNAAMVALDDMHFKPEQTFNFEGRVIVRAMPQVRAGLETMPISIGAYEESTVVLVSSRRIKDAKDAHDLITDLYRQNSLPHSLKE